MAGAAAAASALAAAVSTASAAASAAAAPLQARLGEEKLLYVNPAGTLALAKMLELDTAVLAMVLLASAHATLHRRLVWPPALLAVGIALEQLAIRLGGTHCHGESLIMLSQCSSANSVALYVPALYSSIVAAERLPVHGLARPLAVGLLVAGFVTPYLLQGPGQGWWALADAGSPVVLSSPMWTYPAGIVAALEPSAAAKQAFGARLVGGMPTLLPLVAAGVGIGLQACAGTRALVGGALSPPRGMWWPARVPLRALAALVATTAGIGAGGAAAWAPAGLALPALLACGVGHGAAIGGLLLMLAVPVLLLPAPPRRPPPRDLLLFAIALWQHAYLVVWPAWLNAGLANGATPPDVHLAVCVISALSLAAHARASCFVPPRRSNDPRQQGRDQHERRREKWD